MRLCVLVVIIIVIDTSTNYFLENIWLLTLFIVYKKKCLGHINILFYKYFFGLQCSFKFKGIHAIYIWDITSQTVLDCNLNSFLKLHRFPGSTNICLSANHPSIQSFIILIPSNRGETHFWGRKVLPWWQIFVIPWAWLSSKLK